MQPHHPASSSRRDFLSSSAAGAVAAGATLLAGASRVHAQITGNAAVTNRPADEPFLYCLNSSTVRGQKLTLDQEFEIAAKAGYHGIEPWLPKMHEFVKAGGSLKDLGKKAKDLNLAIPSTIGFAQWIVDDDAQRAKGLEQMKLDMDAVAELGGLRVAAPAIGAQKPDAPQIDLRKIAERYRAICEIGRKIGVVPECEVWGFSRNLTTLADAAFVTIAADHPDACVLLDVYHLYKGGSPVNGLYQLNGKQFHNMHVNDYPAAPARAEITDAARIYPGEGIAPLHDIFRALRTIGYTGYLSLELFSEMLWKRDALEVAKSGLEKTRAAVKKALA